MKTVMVSGCHAAAMSFWQESEMRYYLKLLLEMIQSMCAVDGQLITKACKTIQIFPQKSKLLNFYYPPPPPLS